MLNYITPENGRKAAAGVKKGKVYAWARNSPTTCPG